MYQGWEPGILSKFLVFVHFFFKFIKAQKKQLGLEL